MEAKNITKDPHGNYYAASELLDMYTHAQLIVGALHHFGMESQISEITNNKYTGDPNDRSQKLEFITKQINPFLKEHVLMDTPKLDKNASRSIQLICKYCGKEYKRPMLIKET